MPNRSSACGIKCAAECSVNRAVLVHRLFTGVSRRHLGCLVEEMAVP